MVKINPGKYAIYFASVLLIVAIAFAGVFRRPDVFVLGAGVGLISYGAGLTVPMAVLLSGLSTFLGTFLPFGVTSSATIQGFEGFATEEEEEETFEATEEEEEAFEDAEEEEKFEATEEEEEGFEATEEEEFEEEEEGFEAEGEEFEDEEETLEEGFANAGGDKKKRRRRKPLPDNGTRAEMFQLGKKYKMPSEKDDAEFHLDAGTTFLNAYKSLKPDQISAMTKDTQELINTQKQLMSTLHTLKPLITDGQEMMNTFQGYFGNAGGLGDLGKMADQFAGTK